jgi:hypothetical protein
VQTVAAREERPHTDGNSCKRCVFVALSMRDGQEEAFARLLAVKHVIGEADERSSRGSSHSWTTTSLGYSQ